MNTLYYRNAFNCHSDRAYAHDRKVASLGDGRLSQYNEQKSRYGRAAGKGINTGRYGYV